MTVVSNAGIISQHLFCHGSSFLLCTLLRDAFKSAQHSSHWNLLWKRHASEKGGRGNVHHPLTSIAAASFVKIPRGGNQDALESTFHTCPVEVKASFFIIIASGTLCVHHCKSTCALMTTYDAPKNGVHAIMQQA